MCVFIAKKVKRKFFNAHVSVCLSLSVNVFVFLRSRTFYIHFVSFSFLARSISSYTKIIHHNFIKTYMHTSITCKIVHFCCAYTFNCLFFFFVRFRWYPGFSCLHLLIPFLSFLFFEICSIPWYVLLVLSFIYFYTLFRSFFAVCERAVLKEYTYIIYILHSCECATRLVSIGKDNLLIHTRVDRIDLSRNKMIASTD